ncbi:hypothetical protein AT4G01245 [Arabidopsis thaliana]|uniref:Uncharacterized protein n=1 Tax=Arabidopsis thaliana TaxID=3702 RepID=F4JI00_ARATH|nr:uncharacterized protein AT4G01245 [Arabidopsis thaliana]AEE82000.1 hypothetical protein AT4G01245 [Arabidopsis thaliana]|eukprot:NP_680551.1 hypothetical protein AT4G01245 [Arabidopsis thaliana]
MVIHLSSSCYSCRVEYFVRFLVSYNNLLNYAISSYKELLAKCNQLGRGEAQSSEKLEKALEKIEKLKKRMRELELITEENRAIRDINVSKKCSYTEVSLKRPDIVNVTLQQWYFCCTS